MCWGSSAITENNWGMQQSLAFTVLIKYWLYTLGQSSARSLFKFLSGKSCSASVWGSCNTTTHVGDGSHEGTFPSRAETCFDYALIFFAKSTGEQLPAAPLLHLCDVIPLNVPGCRWQLPVSEMWHHWSLPLVLRIPSSMDLSGCTGASSVWFPLFLQAGITRTFSAESQEMHCWENLCPGLGSSWPVSPFHP